MFMENLEKILANYVNFDNKIVTIGNQFVPTSQQTDN